VYDERFHHHEDTIELSFYSQLGMSKMVANRSKFVVRTVHPLKIEQNNKQRRAKTRIEKLTDWQQ
jgi:hypothetical protein